MDGDLRNSLVGNLITHSLYDGLGAALGMTAAALTKASDGRSVSRKARRVPPHCEQERDDGDGRPNGEVSIEAERGARRQR